METSNDQSKFSIFFFVCVCVQHPSTCFHGMMSLSPDEARPSFSVRMRAWHELRRGSGAMVKVFEKQMGITCSEHVLKK